MENSNSNYLIQHVKEIGLEFARQLECDIEFNGEKL
jgi:hypothetical protein